MHLTIFALSVGLHLQTQTEGAIVATWKKFSSKALSANITLIVSPSITNNVFCTFPWNSFNAILT
jgi:hypothetical protein